MEMKMLVKTPLSTPYTVAEIFCGCGGFSHGFSRTSRFAVVLGNDVKPAALRTFAWNHSGLNKRPATTLLGDIRTISIERIEALLADQGVARGSLDVLIGGPPCQGFSQMRRSQERRDNNIVSFKGYSKLDQDPRNDLVLRFLEVALALRPKVIVIENVPQMLSHHHNGVVGGIAAQVQATLLSEMGYHVTIQKLNAADYGVPQLRERIFFLCSRMGPISFPAATHRNQHSTPGADNGHAHPWTTVGDAIRDLPSPSQYPDDLFGNGPISLYKNSAKSGLTEYLQSNSAFPYNHISRTYKPSILDIIQHMQPGETWDHASRRMQQLYGDLIVQHQRPEETTAQTAARLQSEGQIVQAFYKRYYWSAYTRLAWDKPALTITANANFLGSGRFTHPTDNRGITMREAARLQTFNDDFRFITSANDNNETINIGVGMDMIGEAVPPLLAEQIANQIADHLAEQHEIKSPKLIHQQMLELLA